MILFLWLFYDVNANADYLVFWIQDPDGYEN